MVVTVLVVQFTTKILSKAVVVLLYFYIHMPSIGLYENYRFLFRVFRFSF